MRNLFTLLIGLLFFTCTSKENSMFSGVSLSFDDRSVNEWFQLRHLFKENNVNVTFFITQPDSLDNEEIHMLRTLSKDGHEIGFHGKMHVLSEHYIKEHSYSDYLEKEIDKGLETMDSLGFKCESFAYPYGAKYWFSDFLLLRRFDVIRNVEPLNKDKDLTKIDDIYYSFNGDRTVSAIGFDNNSGITKEMIKRALERAKERKEILMLYAHTPSKEKKDGYFFDVEMLEYIIQEAKLEGIRFCKISDLQ